MRKFSERELLHIIYCTDQLFDADVKKAIDICGVLDHCVGTFIVFADVVDDIGESCSDIYMILRKECKKQRCYMVLSIQGWTEESGCDEDDVDLYHPLKIFTACLCAVPTEQIDWKADIVPSCFGGKELGAENYLESCQRNKEELQQAIKDFRQNETGQS